MVDDVDVAVTLELDAQVLDLEQRGLLQVSLEAIGALLLDGLEVVEASLQGGSLLSVGTARVEQELVGLAVGVLIDLCNSGGRGGRDHRVRNAFGQEVQAQHGDHDEQAGERGCPPHALQDRAVRRGLGQDVAPRGHGGRLEARTDEGQGGLEDDRVGDEDGREHEDRGGGVAQDVLDEDPGGAGARDDHRADVVLAVRGHDVRANDTRQLRDVDEGDRTDDDHHEACRVTRLGEGSPKNEDRHGRHGDTGHRHDDVEDAHDRLGDALAHNRGDGADDRTEEERDQRRAQADNQGETTAVQDASEDVSTHVVRAEEVFGRRALPLGADVTGAVGRDERGQDRHEDDEREDDHRDLRAERHRADA